VDDIFELLKSYSLKKEDWDVKTEWLMDGFLPKGTINVWYADGGSGKSYLAYGVALRLAKRGLRVVYVDTDNPMQMLKERKIDKKLGVHENIQYLHRSSMDVGADELLEILNRNAVGKRYKDMVFVWDGFKEIVGDMNNHMHASRAMGMLMNMRESGATVIVLHHTNKDGKNYQGSNAIRNSCDVMYRVHRQPSKSGTINYNLEVKKERMSVVDVAYSLDVETLEIGAIDSVIASMSEYEQVFTSRVIDALKGGEMNRATLLEALGCRRDDKSAIGILNKFDGVLYYSYRVLKNIYFTLENKNATTTTTTTT